MSWFLVLVVSSTPALEPRPTEVRFSAPAPCPARETFEHELAARTERVRFVASDDATAWVEASVIKKGRRFEGRLIIRTADGARSRKTLQSPRCETLIGAMALTTALVLDPEGAKLGPVVAEPAVETAPASVEVEPPPAPSPVEPPVDAAPAPTVTTAPAAIAGPPPPTPSPPTSVVWKVGVELRGAIVVSSGVSGLLDVGGGGRVGVDVAPSDEGLRASASLGAAGMIGGTISAVAGRVRYAAHLLSDVQVGLAYSARWLRLEFGGFAQLVPVQVEALDGDERTASQRFLWAVGPVGSVALRLGRWSLGVRAGAGVALRQERYRIEPAGAVFGTPAVAFTGAAELGVSLP